MPSSRVFLAILTTILLGVLSTACNAGRTNEEISARPGVSRSPTVPTADPTVEDLLAAAGTAVGVLETEYPDMDFRFSERYNSIQPGDERQGIYEKHGFVEGKRVGGVDESQNEAILRLDVFGSQDQARGFRTDFEEQYHFNDEVWSYVGDPVEVPGWPRTAHFQTQLGSQQISYIFVHGPAAVWLRLRAVEFDSPEAAGVELANVLDLVQASLNETVPIPN